MRRPYVAILLVCGAILLCGCGIVRTTWWDGAAQLSRFSTADRVLVYLSNPATVSINMAKITSANTVSAVWFNPVNGHQTAIGSFPNSGNRSFSTPVGFQDAVLILTADANSTANNPTILIKDSLPQANTETATLAGTPLDDSSTGLPIGNITAGDRTFNDSIFNIRMYDQVLSQPEIQSFTGYQVLSPPTPTPPPPAPFTGTTCKIKPDPTGRYFVDGAGNPFFWLGDTGRDASLFLNQTDLDLYFQSRASQGFTVIDMAALRANPDNINAPNVFGSTPFKFTNGVIDITQPNITRGYDYWDHIDYAINSADQRGLMIAFSPFWIGWQTDMGDPYKYIDVAEAYKYGKFLGQRYASKSNIIWVLGGDTFAPSATEQAIWDSLAKGIAEGVTGGTADYSKTCMSYHIGDPVQVSSSYAFHNSPWLTFNMIQSRPEFVANHIARDRNLTPAKPTGIQEGAYEDNSSIPPLLIRNQAYWSYFSGGFHTYGNVNIWCFGRPNCGTLNWKVALNSQGAHQMTILKNLFNTLPWQQFILDQSVIVSGAGSGSMLNSAVRSSTSGTVR